MSIKITDHEGRPAANGTASNVVGDDRSIVSCSTEMLRELDSVASLVDGAFVIVVRVSGGRYRRRVYLTARAAQAAARGAVERGETASVYLAELKPLRRVGAGEE